MRHRLPSLNWSAFVRGGGAPPQLCACRWRTRCHAGCREPAPVVLLTLPGLAGCREHRWLLKRLKAVTW